MGNISGDNSSFRDEILDLGIEGLVNIGLKTKSSAVFKNVNWTLSNLSRGKPKPDFSKIKKAIAVFGDAVKNYVDEEILMDAFWALSCISGIFYYNYFFLFLYYFYSNRWRRTRNTEYCRFGHNTTNFEFLEVIIISLFQLKIYF